LLKPQPLGGQAIDILGRRLPVAEAGEIAPAQVIDEHQDNTRPLGRGERAARRQTQHSQD
jgi:hypothetical protein